MLTLPELGGGPDGGGGPAANTMLGLVSIVMSAGTLVPPTTIEPGPGGSSRLPARS